MAEKRPNILLITSDQQHYSTLGSVNPKIQTPALDRLAREGVRYDRAYCPNPTCTPTRASIITGMYPSQHGAWSLGTKLFEDVPTVGDALRQAGYATSLVGKAHFQPLKSLPGMESIECQPLLRDLDFWRGFHGPWYGFEHVETARMHGGESHVGQHYAIWMEEKGFTDWRDYFVPWPEEPGGRQSFYDKHRHWSLPEEYHYTTWTGERTCAQIRAAAEREVPFFCWSSFHDPHPPYMVPEPWASMYSPDDMEPGLLTPGEHEANPPHFAKTQEDGAGEWWQQQRLRAGTQWIHGAGRHVYDVEQIRNDMAIYYGMVSFMDRQIGRILETLDATGQAENTLVVFSTDHGHFLGQHGLNAKAIHHYEDLLRVPFLVRWPGRSPAGPPSDAIQNLVDLAPSFLDASGLDVPGTMTGLSQVETWSGGKPARRWSVTENHHGAYAFHMRTYVNERYKMTVYRDGDDGELFDLAEDPGEIHNLWRDPAAAELKTRMLHEFMQATLQSEPMRMPRIVGA